jgi:hypothetical protein
LNCSKVGVSRLCRQCLSYITHDSFKDSDI